MDEGAVAAVDPREVAKFEAMAAEWWDPKGKFRPLHLMNPCRLDYVVGQIAAEFGRDPAAEAPFAGLRLLDLGCGGGLVAEPMARLGAEVVGVDPSEGTVPVARVHAAQGGLAIDYRETTAEALAAAGERFDVVLTLEVVEHVPDPAAYLSTVASLVRPGGLCVVSTLNRTSKAWALAVVGAERVLRWLPPGTHDWKRFVTPEELAEMLEAAGLEVVDRMGMVFEPLKVDWRLDPADLSVNYAMTAVKPG
jgi:2-polyprenyl-6-hydroxyphenyl methylase/3-demethylubiquinone-9 3-methyltransferase